MQIRYGFIILLFLISIFQIKAEENVLDNIKQIMKNEKLSLRERKESLKEYFSKLKFEDIIFTGEELAKEMENTWYKDDAYAGTMGMIIYEYSKVHKIDFRIILDEIKNKKRSVAWRDLMVRVGSEKIRTEEISDDLKKQYFNTVKKIVLDDKTNPHLKVMAINVLSGSYQYGENVSEILNIFMRIIKNPGKDEEPIVCVINGLRWLVRRNLVENMKEKEKVKLFMLESFQNRKKYKENVQVKMAEVLVYTFKNYEILPQLEEMKKGIKDKILKSRIEMLIKKIQKINRSVNIKK